MRRYACIYVEKDVEKDNFEHGCVGERCCVLAESCNIIADTIPHLLAALEERYCLDIDDVWLPGENGEESGIGYNRLETDASEEPSSAEKEAWKRGELPLWIADYRFYVERCEVSQIPRQEFIDAGIKYHE